MASMNRGLNLPQIQRIVTEFEKESSMMDMKEEMMSDAVDDVMDEEEDEEEEGDKILKQVLDEIGVDLSQQVCFFRFLPMFLSECSTNSSSPMHLPALQQCPEFLQIDNPWPSVVMADLLLVEQGKQRMIVSVMMAVQLLQMKTHYKLG